MNPNPHTPLYSAKARIISRLKEYLANAVAKSEFSTLEISLEEIDLWSLMPFLDVPQKVFFSDREASVQYLGAKFLKIYNGHFAIEKAKKAINENPLLVILGAQRFHPNVRPSPEWQELGSHYYVLPQFLFVRKNNQVSLRINIPVEAFERSSQTMRLLLDAENLFSFKGHGQKRQHFTSQENTPNYDQWQQQVSSVHNAFKADLLDKVVLSRKVVLKSERTLKPDSIIDQLNVRPGEHFIFHIQWRSDKSFTSLTPERLFKLRGTKLISDAIAGTRARGPDTQTDLALEQELKNSLKELEEHRYVSSSVLETMRSLGANNASVSGEPELVMKLTHVQHLHTRIHGELNSNPRISTLVDAFHPTPAVGGSPKIDASEWLESNESYDRGFYAAPLGVIDNEGADFCVGIRSCLVNSNELHIFAGAGLVAASTAQAEWRETAAKMKNYPFTVDQSENTTNEYQHEQHPIM